MKRTINAPILALIGLLAAPGALLAQDVEKNETEKAKSKATADASAKASATVEINGKKFKIDGANVRIETEGNKIRIDRDGDGKFDEEIKLDEAKKDADKAAPAEEPGEKETVTTLGVGTRPVDATLAAHLGLGDTGLSVDFVVPDSGAAKTGLEPNDILLKIDGVELTSTEQLRESVTSRKPGDQVELTFLHRGVEKKAKATLGARTLDPRERLLRGRGNRRPFGGDLDDLLGDLDFDFGGAGNLDELRERMKEMQDRLAKQFDEDGFKFEFGMDELPFNKILKSSSSRKMMFSDGDGSIEVTKEDGKTSIKAKDADGKLLYEGPAETDEDREKLPPKVLEKLKKFEGMNMDFDNVDEFKINPPKFKFRLNPGNDKKDKNTA